MSDKQLNEELYCICRGPDDGRLMIQCDGCDEWFHYDCVELTIRQAQKIKKFYCPTCTIENKKKLRRSPRLQNKSTNTNLQIVSNSNLSKHIICNPDLFGYLLEYLYTLDYVKSIARISKFHHDFRMKKPQHLKTMLIREFGNGLFTEQIKKPFETDVYGGIRWLWGLFRDSNELEYDPYCTYQDHGPFYHTFFLLGRGRKSNTIYFPNLWYPIQYGLDKLMRKHHIKPSKMYWTFEYEQKENFFEWMMKQLFKCDNNNYLYFYKWVVDIEKTNKFLDMQRVYWWLQDLGLLNLVQCKPEHMKFVFKEFVYPQLIDNSMTTKGAIQFFNLFINGLHKKICKKCYKDKERFDYSHAE
eukprot:446700_1